MDYLIYYIEAGILANALMIFFEIGISIYLATGIGMVEIRKMAMHLDEEDKSFDFLNLLHYLIPFFMCYLIIMQIILIKKHFNGTAESIEEMLEQFENYKIFKRRNNE